METTTCIRSVVGGCHMFLSNPSEASQVQLQRQLDVLITMTGKKTSLAFFDPTDLLVTECLTCLMDIINDVNSKSSLVRKVLLLLTNLAQCSTMRRCLHKTFNLTPCLSRYLKTQTLSAPDHNGVLCLKLLQKVTYNTRISYQEGYIEELLQFLMENINICEGDTMERCLGLMANLCRHSPCVQMHVKNWQNMKSFCKKLVMLLTHHSPTVVIFSLSLLASLCLHDESGSRLFRSQNINQTFQMMFNILNGDNSVSRRYTVDLFTDLLKHSKIQNSLSTYDHLKSCLLQIMGLLCSSDPETVAKIMELILAFCHVAGLRTIVCKIMLDISAHTPTPTTLSEPLQPIPALAHWAAQGVDIHDNVSLLALQLLKEIYEEMQDMDAVAVHLDTVLPMLTETLMCPLDVNQSVLNIRCLRVVRSLQMLKTLSSDASMRPSVIRSIDARTCQGLLDWQLESNPLALHSTPRTNVLPLWSEPGGDVVLHVLDLLIQFLPHIPPVLGGILSKSLEDSRYVPFLSFGLTTKNRDRVQTTLRLVAHGFTLEGFPNIILGENIASCNSNNCSNQQEDTVPNVQRNHVSHQVLQQLPLHGKENICRAVPAAKKARLSSEDLETSVLQLVEKIQNGLELKEMRPSEIISIYEHRLQSLQTKENHLQDLLEAKTLAVSQADRLISQYRNHKAQLDAEASKLRAVIVDCERRVEEFKEQHNEAQLDRERSHLELEQLIQDNIRLEKVADEHEHLTQIHVEQQQKLENTQRMLATLKQEHKTMSEMHEMLRRHNETLKQQHDVATQQLSELEDERKSLSRQLKEKETKLQETTKNFSKSEERLKKASRNCEQLEIAVDKFREDLSKAEQAKKDLQHQVTSLELVCQQHESSIKDTDEKLHDMKTELDKHAQIAALIHNLSSGKGEK